MNLAVRRFPRQIISPTPATRAYGSSTRRSENGADYLGDGCGYRRVVRVGVAPLEVSGGLDNSLTHLRIVP